MIDRLLPLDILDIIGKQSMKSILPFFAAVMKKSPEFYERVAKRKLSNTLRRMYDEVPSYKKICGQHPLYETAPELSKSNYILPSSLPDLCRNGNIHNASLFVTSSGFSGKPCTWPKSKEEETVARYSAAFSFQLLFQTEEKKTLVINTLTLSSWIGGIVASKILDHSCTVLNTGPVRQEVLRAITTYRSLFDQIIVAGYPPFISTVVEDIDTKDIHVVVGGEACTEEWRDYIYQKLGPGSKVFSAFAASDIGITGATETVESVIIRRLARKNSQLCSDLFGDTTSLPMLFQYNPLQYWISVNDNKELLFTTMNKEILLPLAKYNLKDCGGVISYRFMEQILQKNRVKLPLSLPFPFIYVQGRSDGSINLAGTLVYPESILSILYKNQELFSMLTGQFRLSSPLGLHVDCETKVKPTKKLQNKITTLLQNELFSKGKTLDKIVHRNPDCATITVTLYHSSEYPHDTSSLKQKRL